MNSYTVTAEARFGGFAAELTSTGLILIRAETWKARQPRIVLTKGEPGYPDWGPLLEANPVSKEVKFKINDAADNLADQWLRH